MVLGIFAGVGSGKSLVLEMLKNKGFFVLEADKVAHILYDTDKTLLLKLENKFGKDIIDSKGKLKRQELADIIFKNITARAYINNLLHPLVWQYIKTAIREARENKIDMVVEAAIMPINEENIYDYKLFIDTDDNIRKERLKQNRAYSDEKIRTIIKSQADKKEFKNFCDFTIYNNSSKEELEKAINLILEKIKNENVQYS